MALRSSLTNPAHPASIRPIEKRILQCRDGMGGANLENQSAARIAAADITRLTPALADFGAEIENAYRPLLAWY